MAEPMCSPPSIPLKDLNNALAPVAGMWRQLGVQFGFTEIELNAIQQEHPGGGVNQWLSSMLSAKLENTPGFSWSDVLSVLENLELHVQAAHIRVTHCPHVVAQTGTNPALKELTVENEERLRYKFANLLERACSLIEAKAQPESFRTFAIAHFAPAHYISQCNGIREMVDAITNHGRWDYLRYRPLLRTIQKYDCSGTMQEECNCYEESVANFKATTRLKEWIVKKNFTSSALPVPKLHPGEYSKLSAKVYINITNKMLKYVFDLWDDIARLCQLPDLDAVLHSMKEDCLLVTWLIPNDDKIKNRLRRNARRHRSFFEQRKIQYCLLDKECIYKSNIYTSQHSSSVAIQKSVKTTMPLRHASSDDAKETSPLLPPTPTTSYPSQRGMVRSKSASKVGSIASSVNQDVDEEETSCKCCSCCVIL